MKKPLLTALLLGTLSLSGCALFQPYHQQIQQGNIITPKMIAELKPGMTQTQVKYILGTPDIQDPWTTSTWFYVYTNRQDGRPVVQNKLIVHFDKAGKLVNIEGTYPPPAQLQYKTYTSSR